MVGSLFASKAPQTFTQATLVKTLVSEKQDKKILKEQMITTLHDVSLLEPNDWKNLKLSPATEQALKNALAQLNSNPTAFGPNTAVSDVISDKKDLEKLAKQLIFNLQDIAWMSDADWKEVNISAASQAKLAESASKISGSSASSNTSEDAPLSKIVTDKADLEKLDKEWLFTLSDIKRLEDKHWKQLSLSSASEAALKAAVSASPAKGGNSSLSSIISNKADLATLDKEWIFTLEDVKKLTTADWKQLSLSSESETKLKAAIGSSGASGASDDAKVSSIISDSQDLATLEREWIFTLADVKRLSPSDWQQLRLSSASESKLKAAAGGKSSGGASDDTKVSSIISDSKDLATLEREWIFTLADVKRLSPSDWQQLRLSSASESKLKAAAGGKSSGGASDDTKVSSIISDSKDLATLEREWIFTLADVKRLSPSDWQQLRLSSASESKLKAAAGGKSSGGASDDTKVSSIISDPKDLATLEREWIFTLADVKRLSPSDWQQLRLSSASESKLKAAAGGKSSGGASDDTKVSKIVSDPQDLATLEREWIFTLADVKRLSPSDWQQLRLSQKTESLLRSAIGHGQSAAASSTLVKDLITNPKDLKKLQKEWIFTLQDVARLRKEDWKILGLSPESKAILKGKAGKGKGKKGKKGKKAKKAFKTSKLAKKSAKLVGKGDRRAKLLKQRVKQLDKAIVIAHKLALKAEIKALKAADNIYKLERRKKQLKKAAKAKAKKVAF